eukprot:237842_1
MYDPQSTCYTAQCSSIPTVEDVVKALGLQEHIEGGYFKETYRSDTIIDVNGTQRTASTAIYYIITEDAFSTLHRVQSDEIWHFYLGDPVEMLLIYPDGTDEIVQWTVFKQ